MACLSTEAKVPGLNTLLYAGKSQKRGKESPKKSRNQDICSDSDTYCVPASPANPTTPKDDTPKKIAGLLQQVDVGKYVEHQID